MLTRGSNLNLPKMNDMQKPIPAGNVSRPSRLHKMITFNWLSKSNIVDIIAHFFTILFLYTGIAKFIDFDLFVEQLSESPIPQSVAPLVAWGLPITEFIISLLLFFPRFRLKGFYASLAIMLLFTAYVVTILNFDRELPCSCGGIVAALSWEGHLVFNITSIFLSFIGIRLQRTINLQMSPSP